MTRKVLKLPAAIQITDRKNRKIASAVMLVVLLTLLIVSFPIFKDTRISTCVGTRTERSGIITAEPLVQRFVPSGNHIQYIEIHLADCVTDTGEVVFTIENKKGEELFRETIPMSELSGDIYYRFDLSEVKMQKDHTYYFKVLAQGMPNWDAPKLWLSNNVKDEIRDVIFRTQPYNQRLQSNVEIGYAQFHYRAFFLSLISIIVSCGTILIKLNIDEKTRRKICLWIMLLMPIVMFIITESLNNGSISKKTPIVWIINYIIYFSIYCMFFAITNRLRFTVLFSNTLIFLIAITNFYKLQFRGEPFTLSDFAQLRTAVNVSSQYDFSVRYQIFTTACVFMLATAIVSRFRYSMRHKRYRALLGVLTVSVMTLLVTALFNTDRYSASKDSIMKRLGIVNNVWNQQKNFSDNGVMVAITMNAKYLAVDVPAVYNLENLDHVVGDVHDNYGVNLLTGEELSVFEKSYTLRPGDRMPNIICIMDESYCDFSQFGDLEFTLDYSPFMDSLCDNPNVIRGDLFVSTFGGGTANSEFEFLTGNTMLAMPRGSIPYQQYIDSETGSISRTLHNLGYRTIAVHPYLGSGWNRPQVYECMAFDEFLDQEAFEDPEYIRSYISDACSFDKIIELYEDNRDNGNGQPLFVFNVTMQNHGSYSKSYDNFEPDVFLASDPGVYTEAEQYFSVARQTDYAIQDLVSYFANCSEPTVICFFGDHLPSFHDGFYEDMLGVADTADCTPDQMQKLYMTDFFIWANYPVAMPDIENISLNYLSTVVMQVAGIPLTEYQLFLTNMYREYPVLTTVGLADFDGNYVGGTDLVTSTDIWNYYNVLEYNNVFEDADRYNAVFDYPMGIAELLNPDQARGSREVDMVPATTEEPAIMTEESEEY